MQYGFVTRVTSLVVVKPSADDASRTQEAPLRPVPADGAERDAENLTGNNKYSESESCPFPFACALVFFISFYIRCNCSCAVPLTRPGPGHVPISFKPLLFSQQSGKTATATAPPLAERTLGRGTHSDAILPARR